MERLSKNDLTILLALLGIAAGAGQTTIAAKANPMTTGNDSPLYVADKTGAKKGADSACGKGSCGTDDKGAKAAKEKHAAKSKETKKADSTKKDDKKPSTK